MTNGTDAILRLNRLVIVQRLNRDHWEALATEMTLVLSCPPHRPTDMSPGCVALGPRETIEPPPGATPPATDSA